MFSGRFQNESDSVRFVTERRRIDVLKDWLFAPKLRNVREYLLP